MNDTGLTIHERLFDETRMYERLERTAEKEHLEETARALSYMKERHDGQFRKGNRFAKEQVPYINHPLLMACHAHALGIRDDTLLASILLHDVVEDTGVTAAELPFSEEVRTLVSLVSFFVPEGMTKEEAKEQYYARIRENPKACVIKLIDRCNNVSTMAGSFTPEKTVEYIHESEHYVLPLSRVLQDMPAYSDLSFILKYHIISILETIKCMLREQES